MADPKSYTYCHTRSLHDALHISSCLVDPEIGRLGDVDTARTLLTTASGRLCVISNTRRSGYGYDPRVEAFCSRGMLRAGNVRGDTVCTLTPAASTGAAILPGFPERYQIGRTHVLTPVTNAHSVSRLL